MQSKGKTLENAVLIESGSKSEVLVFSICKTDFIFNISLLSRIGAISWGCYSKKENISPMIKRNAFFDCLIENHPFFNELNFDMDNITVQEDFYSAQKLIRSIANPANCLFDTIDFIKSIRENNNEFSIFGDIEKIEEDDFWRLELILNGLLAQSQGYHYLSLDEIKNYKNTAVRIYNKLYGKGHMEYKGRLNIQAWTTHRCFAEYLLSLDWNIQMKTNNIDEKIAKKFFTKINFALSIYRREQNIIL